MSGASGTQPGGGADAEAPAVEAPAVEAPAADGGVLCEVLRSPRREGMYLYVDRRVGLARVPERLLEVFGTPQPALLLHLHPARHLARAEAGAVLQALREQGYYLQMPPGRDEDTRN